jgi:hypothetical protein
LRVQIEECEVNKGFERAQRFTAVRAGGFEQLLGVFPFLVFNSYALCIWIEFFICVASTRGRVFEDLSLLDVEHVIAHDSTA